jgi:hypothetical protein
MKAAIRTTALDLAAPAAASCMKLHRSVGFLPDVRSVFRQAEMAENERGKPFQIAEILRYS